MHSPAHLRSLTLLCLLVLAITIGGCSDAEQETQPPAWTEAEAQFIKEHESVMVGADPAYPPVDFLDGSGAPAGMMQDVLELIGERSGLNFRYFDAESWSQVELAAEDGQIDLLSAVARTPKREAYLSFTDPVFSYPSVILVREDHHQSLSLDELTGQDVGVIMDYAESEYVRESHPEINLIPVRNAAEALRRTASGNLEACVMSLALASYTMEQEGITNLRVAGETDYTTNLGFAVQADQGILGSVIAKAIDRLSEEDLRAIRRKWIYVKQEGWAPSMEQVLGALALLALIGLAVLFWLNRSLKHLVALRTAELETELEEHKLTSQALEASEERYDLAVRGSNTGIVDLDLKTDAMYWSSKLKEMLGYGDNVEPSRVLFDSLIHPDDRPAARKAFSYHTTHGGVFDIEARVQRTSGRYRWFHIMGRMSLKDGEPVRLTGSVVDVTERHEAEEAARAAEKVADYERNRSEQLLLNILPEAIAEQLKDSQQTIADSFEDVSVLFADIEGFTQFSQEVPAEDLVKNLNSIFSAFDVLAEKHGLEKIKTIGDAYMIAGGLPEAREDHAEAMAEMALDMLSAMEVMREETGLPLQIRIGMNSGPVVAGVIGAKKFIYDLWGDAVNTASRMESHGLRGCIHVTQASYERLRARYTFAERTPIEVKGKGTMRTWFLTGRVGHDPVSDVPRDYLAAPAPL